MMKRYFTYRFPQTQLFALCLFFLFGSTDSLLAQTDRPIGINLTGIEDYSPEYVFTDVFRQCRPWIAHENRFGAAWSSGVEIPLRADGYPLKIPYDDGTHAPQIVRTLLFFGSALPDHYPGGNYRLMASGSGVLRLWGAASGSYRCPVDTLVYVDSSLGGIAIEIEESLESDPVHAIRFIMPGFANSYKEEIFNPALLSFLDDFSLIRFMDWMKTNFSPVRHWEDRNKTDYYTQTLENGVAPEYIIRLCNSRGKDPWICIPHAADDNYIENLARLFRDSLDPERKLYIEYSNEVWNSIFTQSGYADSMGAALGYSGNPWEQGWQFYAKRSADVFRIFEAEFGADDRLVKVLASQSSPWLSNYIISRFREPGYNPDGTRADALAIAPYFGGRVAMSIGQAGLADSVTVDDILDSLERSLPEAFGYMDEVKAVADSAGLQFLAYEGGQHLVAYYPYHNDTAFVSKLVRANRHERIYDIYCRYFNHWFDSTGGGLFAHYSSHSSFGKWGSWGVKEYLEDTLAPKYRALQECVFSFNRDTVISGRIEALVPDKASLRVFPQPGSNGRIWIQHSLHAPRLRLFDMQGRAIGYRIASRSESMMEIRVGDYHGMLILVLEDDEQRLFRTVCFL